MQESQFNPGFQILQEVQPSSPSQGNQNVQQDFVKLPEIKIPIFDGDIIKWRYFRDLVSDLIINNAASKDSAKFFHLYNCLAPNLQQQLLIFHSQQTTSQSPGSFLPPGTTIHVC